MLVEFTAKDKEEMFDELAEHFYKQNFGQMSKSDFETLMFHFYIKRIVKQNQNATGVLDYNSCSDYKISRDLGITQQRVKSLKIKSHLLYPIDFSWQDSFASLAKNIRFDRQRQKVIISIPDPNLYYEVQDYLEEHGGYIEKQLNGKLLQLRVEYYIDLLVKVYGDEKSRKQLISEAKKQCKINQKEEKIFDDKQIGKSLLELGVNVSSIVSGIVSSLSPSSPLEKLLTILLEKM